MDLAPKTDMSAGLKIGRDHILKFIQDGDLIM
jgi:hypothetical protein